MVLQEMRMTEGVNTCPCEALCSGAPFPSTSHKCLHSKVLIARMTALGIEREGVIGAIVSETVFSREGKQMDNGMMLLDFLLSHLLHKTWTAIVETDDLNSQTWADRAHLAPFLHLRKEPQHICGLSRERWIENRRSGPHADSSGLWSLEINPGDDNLAGQHPR
ncbi:unnamed protein product [Brugia pahangi]|uniref:N-acetyltransferase domain-containing protein n=1 Tax=Brugia pahangi TaxID=6280 RepID=A0A0N4T5F9_BRUPA|nr:unnamed protein product [Brugia pahangi]